MQEISTIKTRITQYLNYKGISKYKFYKETGITRGILDQKNGISEENTARFIAYFPEVNIEWLITGNGEMLKADTYKQEGSIGIASEPTEDYGVNWRDKYHKLLGEVEVLRELQGLSKKK